jgi:hypothetical protein
MPHELGIMLCIQQHLNSGYGFCDVHLQHKMLY